MAPKAPSQLLPLELLEIVGANLGQSELYACTRTSKLFYLASVEQLYRSARVAITFDQKAHVRYQEDSSNGLSLCIRESQRVQELARLIPHVHLRTIPFGNLAKADKHWRAGDRGQRDANRILLVFLLSHLQPLSISINLNHQAPRFLADILAAISCKRLERFELTGLHPIRKKIIYELLERAASTLRVVHLDAGLLSTTTKVEPSPCVIFPNLNTIILGRSDKYWQLAPAVAALLQASPRVDKLLVSREDATRDLVAAITRGDLQHIGLTVRHLHLYHENFQMTAADLDLRSFRHLRSLVIEVPESALDLPILPPQLERLEIYRLGCRAPSSETDIRVIASDLREHMDALLHLLLSRDCLASLRYLRHPCLAADLALPEFGRQQQMKLDEMEFVGDERAAHESASAELRPVQESILEVCKARGILTAGAGKLEKAHTHAQFAAS